MKKIAFITPPDAAYGFGLSGVPQVAAKPAVAEEELVKIMREQSNGLAIIEERMLKDIPEERLQDLEKEWRGIFLVLPSPVKPPADEEDYAARLIRRAIGYHVRLKL